MANFAEYKIVKDVPYIKVLLTAEAVVKDLCDGDDLRKKIGADYIFFNAAATLFTDINRDDIDNDIDGFMAFVYSNGFHDALNNGATMYPVFKDMCDRGMHLCEKPPMDVLIGNAAALVDELTSAVKKLTSLNPEEIRGLVASVDELLGGNEDSAAK